MAQPSFAPDTVNQHVQVGSDLYIGNPGQGWTLRPRSVTTANDFKIQQQKNKVREDEFLGRVQGIPDALSALRTEIGIPQAEQTFIEAGQTVQNVSGQIRDIAPRQGIIAKQVGISAPRLAQRTAAETARLQPTVESASRGLESAQLGLSGLLGEFATSSQNIISPFEIESGFLGESIKNSVDIWKAQLSADLDRELENIKQTGLNDRASLDRANELAKSQLALTSGSFTDLGNRVALIDPTTGREVANSPKSPESPN